MFLVCGEALYDVFVDQPEGESGPGVLLRAIAGGSPFNVAIGMARLGSSVSLASDIATDHLGARLFAQLEAEGVDTSFLRRSAQTCALAIVSTDAAGKASYSFSGLEKAKFHPAAVALAKVADRIHGVHLGSIAMASAQSSRALRGIAKRFCDRALVSLDPNIRLSIIPDRSVWLRAFDEIRPHCHVIKVSDEDIDSLYGDVDAVAVCKQWLSAQTALVVLTRGDAGAVIVSQAAGTLEVPAVATDLGDTVGAGDSYMAALLHSLVGNGWTSLEAIASLSADQLVELGKYAARAAAITCSRRGPDLPSAADLMAHSDGATR